MLYYEMTKNEKLAFNSRMVAHWMQAENFRPIMLPLISRKVRNRDGWYHTQSYCVWDCNSEWSPIDPRMVLEELHIETEHFDNYKFKETLRSAGYDAREINGGIVILPQGEESSEEI